MFKDENKFQEKINRNKQKKNTKIKKREFDLKY